MWCIWSQRGGLQRFLHLAQHMCLYVHTCAYDVCDVCVCIKVMFQKHLLLQFQKCCVLFTWSWSMVSNVYLVVSNLTSVCKTGKPPYKVTNRWTHPRFENKVLTKSNITGRTLVTDCCSNTTLGREIWNNKCCCEVENGWLQHQWSLVVLVSGAWAVTPCLNKKWLWTDLQALMKRIALCLRNQKFTEWLYCI